MSRVGKIVAGWCLSILMLQLAFIKVGRCRMVTWQATSFTRTWTTYYIDEPRIDRQSTVSNIGCGGYVTRHWPIRWPRRNSQSSLRLQVIRLDLFFLDTHTR